jgi:hypothetical protein
MTQFYTDPSRETDTYALPNAEVFYSEHGDLEFEDCDDGELQEQSAAGYYWWFCFPGCLPDSDPVGPFLSEEAAMENAREYAND